MRIFCTTCRQYILDASDKFVVGGPYHGAMFQRAAGGPASGIIGGWPFRECMTAGDLTCPLCSGPFIEYPSGVLATEHGLIKSGQKTLNVDISHVHEAGELKNMLKGLEFSEEGAANPVAVDVPQKEPEATLPPKQPPKPKKKAKQLSSLDLFLSQQTERIVALSEKGKTNEAISTELGISLFRVNKVLTMEKTGD